MSSRSRTLSRREMLRMVGFGVAGTALAACAAPTPQVVKEVVTVKETVMVEGTAQVVEKEKVVEKIVTAVPTAAPSVAQQEGVLWGLQYDPHVETYNRLAAFFKEKTGGATLKVAPQAWPIETKLIAALSAGNQPDVICIMGKQCLPLYLQNAMMPVEDLYQEMGTKPEDWTKDGIESVSWKGHLYGVCLELGAIGYPVNVPVEDVEAAGIADQYPPTNGKFWFDNFEQMWALAKALQKEENGTVVRWGLSSKGWDAGNYLMILRSLLIPKNSDWWDLANAKFMVDTEEGVEAMRLYAETPVKMGIETELAESHVDACLAGKVAIGRGNGTPAIQINEKLGYHFELAGSPLLNGEIMVGVSEAGWGFQAPRLSKHPDISREFIKMMLTDEGCIEYAKIYGGIPATKKSLWGRKDWFVDQDPETPLNKYFDVLMTYVAPVVRYYGEQFGYAAEIDKAVPIVSSKVRLGEATSEEACKELQGLFDAQYKTYLDDVAKYEIAE